jgi:hypothetical protein
MLGKLLIAIGVVSIVIGVLVLYVPGAIGWIGRLPGDINIDRNGTRIFVPITSMIIISIVLTVIVNLFFKR